MVYGSQLRWGKIIYLKNLYKIILSLSILITFCSCYKSFATAEAYVDILGNKIGVCKNLDNADIVLANGQNISNVATKREVEIQEQE